MNSEIADLVASCSKLGDLSSLTRKFEEEYVSLPVCVIDAVFSIGALYISTERTVLEFCQRYGWDALGVPGAQEHRIDDLIAILKPYVGRWQDAAVDVFNNSQRTSSRSGILKAEAVNRFCLVFQRFGIQTNRDAVNSGLRAELRSAIAEIPGQRSGLSLNYCLILAGNENAVKADRMVTRFVADALGRRNVRQDFCERLVREAAAALKPTFPNLTPSLLDYAIWNYESPSGKKGIHCCGTTAKVRSLTVGA